MVEDLPQKPQWKKDLEAALANARAGRGTFYENEEEFMAALASNFKKTAGKRPKKEHHP